MVRRWDMEIGNIMDIKLNQKMKCTEVYNLEIQEEKKEKRSKQVERK